VLVLALSVLLADLVEVELTMAELLARVVEKLELLHQYHPKVIVVATEVAHL
tara:strand:+ start:284 stop:439 length:156 start_codon:yes stop_codon:yes gene_type:complete